MSRRSRREAVEAAAPAVNFDVDEDLSGWAAAASAMCQDGWTVEFLSPHPPVALIGTLPTGDKFFFRDARAEVVLNVGGEDPSMKPTWIGAYPYRDASYMPADEAIQAIFALTQNFIEQTALDRA
jgi:hypothetical protein